jgi:hypothetical protein
MNNSLYKISNYITITNFQNEFSTSVPSKLQHKKLCNSYLLLHLPCEGILHIPTSSHHCESANDHRTGWRVETWSHTGHTCNSLLHPLWQNPISSYEGALVQELALHPAPPAFLLYAAHCQLPAHMFLIFNVYTSATESMTECYTVTVLYSGGARFKSQPIQQLSWLRFHGVPSVPTGISCDSATK